MSINFRKKFIPAFICLLILALVILLPFGTTHTGLDYADSLVFLKKDIYINGVRYDNYRLKQPFTVSEGSTYVPVTDEVMAALGFESRSDSAYVELICSDPAEIEMADRVVNNLQPVPVESRDDVYFSIVEEFDIGRSDFWKKLKDDLERLQERFGLEIGTALQGNVRGKLIPTSFGDVYDSGDCYYIRLGCLTSVEDLGISAYYDVVSGLYLSTDPAFPAETYLNEENRDYIQGRAEYMRSCNRKLEEEEARGYEYLFRHEAFTAGVEEDLLMAICKAESDFRMDIAGRAVGMMQLMPGTVEGAGWDLTDVLNPHGNIEFGAIYIADRLKRYSGNEVTALSAYNQGIGAVSGGNYSTAYANKVIGFKNTLRSWCTNKGYGNTFRDRVEAQ